MILEYFTWQGALEYPPLLGPDLDPRDGMDLQLGFRDQDLGCGV